jgi:hypothetical protein
MYGLSGGRRTACSGRRQRDKRIQLALESYTTDRRENKEKRCHDKNIKWGSRFSLFLSLCEYIAVMVALNRSSSNPGYSSKPLIPEPHMMGAGSNPTLPHNRAKAFFARN